jgi:predicted ATPase
VLSPTQLAQRLDQRLRILAGGERGAVERHATLRAAIDWSYDLLTPTEQQMLARLSVFAGGCTLDAAESVCAGGPIESHDVLDLLSGLVLRSLVVADTADPTDTAAG